MILGLGRLKSEDDRDKNFPMSLALPSTTAGITFRYWNEGKTKLNQGQTPQCVTHAWTHWVLNGPITKPPGFIIQPAVDYAEAQKIDEWPGENYAGTSVRAGAKVQQARGIIDSYLWAFRIEDIIKAILIVGPVVIGTNWYRDMSWPNEHGLIKPGGVWDGGHAFLLNGINLNRGVVRLQNSWGTNWGHGGDAWMELEDVERLVIKEDGEGCLAIEKNWKAKPL